MAEIEPSADADVDVDGTSGARGKESRLQVLREEFEQAGGTVPASDGEQLLAEGDSVGPDAGDGVSPKQQEFPFAIVEGNTVTALPQDLYIPPEALEVFLEAFEGPLDLLLYLIRRQNLDILDIQVAQITTQYVEYVELMQSLQLELAAEYLVMAAMLAEIKSRMLLPRTQVEEAEDEDPRAELIRRLQEYERFKTAAAELDELARVGREVFPVSTAIPEIPHDAPEPDVELQELLLALARVLRRAQLNQHHNVTFEPLSVRERMGEILERLNDGDGFVPFVLLFRADEGRLGVVVSFLAMMELIKSSMIEVVQSEPFAPIHMRLKAAEDDHVQ